MIEYGRTVHRDFEDEGRAWRVQRDETSQLEDLEVTSFSLVLCVFFSPAHQMVTMDDDLIGTHVHDIQVKTLSSGKAEREGHMADVVAHALFHAVLSVRARRRGEGPERGAKSTMDRPTKKATIMSP